MASVIPLTKGYETVVDDEDFPILSRWSWNAQVCANGRIYARRPVHRKLPGGTTAAGVVFMHRQLLGFPIGDVDHIDRDGLNNRRRNLRPCSRSRNAANSIKRRFILGRPATSEFKGVSWNKNRGKWRATVFVEGKQRFLGNFDDETLAAIAYDDAARMRFGEFARTNF